MQINFSRIISFKVASYPAYFLTNGLHKVVAWETYAWKQSDRGGEQVEMFSVLTQIVKAA